MALLTPYLDWDDQIRKEYSKMHKLGYPNLDWDFQVWRHIIEAMASQQKQNPVWDNPNIDSGIGSYKIQKKSKLGYD